MSLKVFSFGNNKVEAVESARVGLEKMEREIRQAYVTIEPPTDTCSLVPRIRDRVDRASDHRHADHFGNDLGAAGGEIGTIECGTPCEYIAYKLTDDCNVPRLHRRSMHAPRGSTRPTQDLASPSPRTSPQRAQLHVLESDGADCRPPKAR